jgi:phosphohistidine phosphatase
VNLYLVRHAEAVAMEKNSRRPLTRAGRRVSRRMARFLKTRKLRVAAIWHSRLDRSVQTAQILAEVVTSQSGLVHRSDLEPDSPIRTAMRALEAQADDIMIVGHLPHLEKLASRLLARRKSAGVIDLAKGGIACLQRSDHRRWRIRWLVIPDLVGRLS